MRTNSRVYTQRQIVFGISLFVSAISTLFFSSRRIALYDYNYIANAIHRLSLGENPYRDFDLVLPPITFLPGYIIHHFLKFDINSSILISALATQAIALLSLQSILSRIIRNSDHLINQTLYSVVMIGAGVINVISIYPNYIYDSLASALAMAALAYLIKYQEKNKYRFLLLSQLFAVLTLLTKLNMGGSLILGFVIVRMYILIKEKNFKRIITEASGIFTITILFLVVIASFGLSNFIEQTIIAPSKFKGVTQLGQLAQYNYPLLIVLMLIIISAKYLRIKRTDITKYSFLLLIITLILCAMENAFTSLGFGDTFGILFPHVNFIYPMIMLVSLNCLLASRILKSDIFTILVVLPIFFFGTFLSQGWVGSSYSLTPLLILLTVTIYLSSDIKFGPVQPYIFNLFILVIIGNFLILALSGNRLGYVADGGVREKNYNWHQIGSALGAKDISEANQIKTEIRKSQLTGSIVEFPAEDLLEEFSSDLTPWNRCLQFTFICPSKTENDIILDFQRKEPNVIVIKQVTQINRSIEPILTILEPVIEECYVLGYSNKTYKLFHNTISTRGCLSKFLEVNNE